MTRHEVRRGVWPSASTRNWRNILRPCAVLLAILSTLPSPIQAGEETPRLYIAPMTFEQVDKSDGKAIENFIATHISRYRAVELLTEDAARALIAKSRTQELLSTGDCARQAGCVQDLAQLLDSNYLVRTNAIGLRSKLLVNAELLDAARGSILSKVEWEMARPLTATNDDFVRSMDELVAPLKRTGELLVVAEAPGSVLTADKKRHGTGEAGRVTLTLPIGTYALELTHPEYYPAKTTLLVPAGHIIWEPDQISYAERATPWYKAWWFWTGVAAAAGGGTAAYILLKPEPEGPPDPLPAPPFGTVVLRF